MLQNLIPNFDEESQKLTELADAGWVMGFNCTWRGPEIMHNSYPQAWRDVYEKQNYIFMDPVAAWSLTGHGVRRWSEINVTLDRKPFMDHARMFGLNYGLALAIRYDNINSFLTVAKKKREFTDDEAAALNTKFHVWHTLVTKPVALDAVELSLLRGFRDGKTRQEIATAVGLSDSTVKRRLQDAMLKLGCTSRTQAVAYAAVRGLI